MTLILASLALAQSPENPQSTHEPVLSPRDVAQAPLFDAEALRARVLQSQEAFVSLVATQPRYTYTEAFSSWAGFGHTVTVTVDSGRVVEHGFRSYGQDGAVLEEWVERGDTLNTHGRSAPMTMEEHYARCLDTVLSQDPTHHQVYLSFFDSGVLEHCTYREVNCADDCSQGTELGSFRFLP